MKLEWFRLQKYSTILFVMYLWVISCTQEGSKQDSKKIKPGIVTDLGTTMDLFTTFSHLAGVPVPTDRIIDGQDLSQRLFNNKKSPRKAVFYYRGDELYAVRLGAYKAHYITETSYGQNTKKVNPIPLLYNLNVDPGENFEISQEHPEILKEINAIVKEHEKKMVKGADQLKDWDYNPFEKK